ALTAVAIPAVPGRGPSCARPSPYTTLFRSSAGVHNLTAVFTPTDATNYSGATATATVTVTAAPVTLTWTPATPLVYGTTLALTAEPKPARPDARRDYEGTTELTAAKELSAG